MNFTCARCGNVNPAGAQFCSNCGNRLQPEQQEAGAGLPSPPPPQQAPPPYPQYPQYPPPPPQARSDKSALALVLAILSLVTCGALTGIPGMIIARGEMNAIRQGLAPAHNMGTVKWAWYLSIAGTVLSVTCGCLYFLGALTALIPAVAPQ